jgi:hypothetical protein
MNRRTHNSSVPAPPLTDAAIDAALRDDTILPSSGFLASVLSAVEADSTSPPLAFPWKRAVPGLIAAAAVVVLLLGVVVSAIVHAFQAAPRAAAPIPTVSLDWRIALQPLFHNTAPAAVFWSLTALAIAGFALLLCRRLIALR